MLKNKLSHIAILEEQVEKLQDLANQFSVITGHGLEEIEDGIVRLLTPRALDGATVAEFCECGISIESHTGVYCIFRPASNANRWADTEKHENLQRL